LTDVTRLTNRVAVFTFITAFAFVVGLISLPKVFESGAVAFARVLAAAPLVASMGLLTWVRRLRARLREARGGRVAVRRRRPSREVSAGPVTARPSRWG
jgi:hypothetical protein